MNSGQTCSALTRMLVPRARLAEVEELAVETAETYTHGRSLRRRHPPRASRVGRRSASVCVGYINKGIDEGRHAPHRRGRVARRPREGLLRPAHRVLERDHGT